MDTRSSPATAHDVAQPLIEALQAGILPEENFFSLFSLYYQPVRQFFGKRGFSPADAEDLTQETFLGVHRGIGSFRTAEPFGPWLFTIAANVYRKRLRYLAANRRQGEEVELDEQIPSGAERGGETARPEQPEQEALRAERARLLRAAIARMPERMRACLLLRVDSDLEYQQIASVLRLSVGTVKAHLFQARQQLRGQLLDYFADDRPSGQEEKT